jgi:hypothetical protein
MLEGPKPRTCPRCSDGSMRPAGEVTIAGVEYRLDECSVCRLTEMTRR